MVQIAVRQNQGKYSFLGTARLINAYAEQQGQDGKAPMAVVPCPGLTLFSSVTDTPCRGTIYLPDLDVAYSIHYNSVYKVTSAGTATRIGTIPGTDFVQISRNQADPPQISIHCAEGDYYIASDIVREVTDPHLPDEVVSSDQIAGYTAYGDADRRVFISGINQTESVSSEDYATAEQSADPLVAVRADRGDLFVFKEEHVEPWRNTGNADYPFEPIGGALIKKGLLSATAIVGADNTLMWPTHDRMVCRLAGYQTQRISTHAIDRVLKDETSPSNIIGFEHSDEGHTFASWTGTSWTRCYDAATQVWHERESFQLGYWRARFPFRAWNKTIVGDALTGNLYYIDSTVFTEGGSALVWGMDTPMFVSPTGAGRIDWIRIDFLTGHGQALASAQGYDPVLMLSWSTDGGNTWRGNRHLKLGKRGKYETRVIARRLGRFADKGVAFRLRVSDPIPRAIAAIEAGITPLVMR